MKSFFTIFFIIILMNNPVKGQEDYQLTAGIGYIDSFHKQIGIEFSMEFEGKIIGEWTGIYVQSRSAYLTNHGRSYDGNEIVTSRYDIGVGIAQYLTPEFSIWRPRIGLGGFFSIQDFDEELTANSYRLTTELSVGIEWSVLSLWSVDSFAWGFGYVGTYHKFEVFGEDVKSYENHIMLVCSYSF